MHEVEVIEDQASAATALNPLRLRMLAELRTPASAAALAERLGLPRQKVNYHLRTLEAHGLLSVAEERKHGGLTERVLVATAASYVVSPSAMGESMPDPATIRDRLSARYLIALAARLIREAGSLMHRAEAAGKRLPTLAIDTELRFASADDQARFADELATMVTRLAARYHDEGGRPYRLVLAAHPSPKEEA